MEIRSNEEMTQRLDVVLGKSTIGEQIDDNLLAYIVRSEEAIYVDKSQFDRVVKHFGARQEGSSLIITKGQPWKGLGFVLTCAVKSLAELPTDKLVDFGDAKVEKDLVCSLLPAGDCVDVVDEAGKVVYSHKTPSYGMSLCLIEVGETCDSWVAEEFVDTYKESGCQPDPPVNKKVSAYVCSLP